MSAHDHKRWVLRWDPELEPDGNDMEFRLTYDGPLLSSKECASRKDHKHEVRRQLHPQLKRFWSIHPWLIHLSEHKFGGGKVSPGDKSALETIADRFARSNGYRFVPLVREELGLLCGLDITFLRPQRPGLLIVRGDIDNRLKTLFDALKVPSDGAELPSATPLPGEDPMFCLVEDDAAITRLSVEADYLLGSISSNTQPAETDARILIKVTIQPYHQTTGTGIGDMGFV